MEACSRGATGQFRRGEGGKAPFRGDSIKGALGGLGPPEIFWKISVTLRTFRALKTVITPLIIGKLSVKLTKKTPALSRCKLRDLTLFKLIKIDAKKIIYLISLKFDAWIDGSLPCVGNCQNQEGATAPSPPPPQLCPWLVGPNM